MEQFEKKWNILRKIWLLKKWYVWEKAGYFWEKKCILPFNYFSIRPFLCNLDLSRKWNILRKNRVFLRKIRVLGPTRTLGEPFVENPTDLVPLSARLSKRENFWETSVAILDGILLTHTSVIGQQNINIQIKYKVIVSQVSVVMSQEAHRKCWKMGFARGTWSSGKWQVVPSRKFTYPKFSQMFPKKNQKTFSFWLLGNAKNPHWSKTLLI